MMDTVIFMLMLLAPLVLIVGFAWFVKHYTGYEPPSPQRDMMYHNEVDVVRRGLLEPLTKSTHDKA